MSWTTKKLAKATGLTDRYIRYLIEQKEIAAEKAGRDWLISDDEAARFVEERTAQKEDKNQ